MGGSSTASGASVTVGSVASRVRSLKIEAWPCWKLLYCCTRSWIGAKNRFRYKKKATRAPRAQRVVHHHVPADAEQGGLAQPPHQLRAGAVDGVDVGRVDVGVAVLADDVAVVDDVAALAVVGGDDTHAVQALGEVGEHVGDAVADPVVAAFGCDAEPERHQHESGNDEQHGDDGQA